MQTSDVHFELSQRAAEIANLMLAQDPRVPPQFINVFVPNGQRNLGITFDEAFTMTQSELVPIFHEIGKRAVKRALVENPELIGGVIIANARKGINYFEEYH